MRTVSVVALEQVVVKSHDPGYVVHARRSVREGNGLGVQRGAQSCDRGRVPKRQTLHLRVRTRRSLG